MNKKQSMNIVSALCILALSSTAAYADAFPKSCQTLVDAGLAGNTEFTYSVALPGAGGAGKALDYCDPKCDLLATSNDPETNAQNVAQCHKGLAAVAFESSYQTTLSQQPYQLSPTAFDSKQPDDKSFLEQSAPVAPANYPVQSSEMQQTTTTTLPIAPQPVVKKPAQTPKKSPHIHWF